MAAWPHGRMAASEDVRLVHLLYFRFNMFTYIVTATFQVSFAFPGESELGHDGSETAGVWTLLQITEGNDLC